MLHGFVEQGNTVVVIEHNLDVVKTADWIIDLGPEGGEDGGRIVAQGTPEQVAQVAASHTGAALRRALHPDHARRVGTAAVSKAGQRSAGNRRSASSEEGLDAIAVRGARQHNLKGIDLDIPRHKMTVCSGPSGSGKSSLAIDTLYAEGQRRYVESLSSYARQFLAPLQKPRVERISGLSPAISIEQKTTSKSPRSTVGTVTEIHDYLRILYGPAGASPLPGLRHSDRHPDRRRDRREDPPPARGNEGLRHGTRRAARRRGLRGALGRAAQPRVSPASAWTARRSSWTARPS